MKTRSILSTAAILAVAAVILSPKTAWLPGLVGNGVKILASGGTDAMEARVLAAQPNNGAFALADAGTDPAKLRAVVARFPQVGPQWIEA